MLSPFYLILFLFSSNAVDRPDLWIGRSLSTTATQSTPRWVTRPNYPSHHQAFKREGRSSLFHFISEKGGQQLTQYLGLLRK